MAEDCLFCKIASGEISAELVYQDQELVAIRDINPQAPQHLLLIPRKHIRTTLDLTEEDGHLIGHLHQVAGRLAQDLGIADDGFRLVNNCNSAGGQVVWHIHFHLLGGREMGWPPG